MQLVLPSISLLRRFNEGRERLHFGRRRLPARTAVGFSLASETVIRCLKGQVWITDGRAGDVILSAGENFVAPKRAKIVVEALEKSLVEIRG